MTTPSIHTQAVQPPSTARVLLFYFLMLVALGVTVLLGYLAYQKYLTLETRMIALGWKKFLWNNTFMPGCLISTACQGKLWLGLTWGVPQWLPWTPLGLLVFAALFKPHPKVMKKDVGQAFWADQETLKPYLNNGKPEPKENPRRGYAGVLVTRGKAQILRPPLRVKCGHSWVVAGTGGGKSSRYLKVLHAFAAFEGSSSLTLDLKYPDLESGLLDCALPYAREGYPVQVFTPYDRFTARIDLYAYARTLDDANLLAEAFVPEGNEMTEFYRAQARTLLKALLYGAANAEVQPTPRELYLMVKG